MRNSYFSACFCVILWPPSDFLGVIIELKMAEFHSSKSGGGGRGKRSSRKYQSSFFCCCCF